MPNFKLDRQVLASFLPNHESIVAFEKLMNFVIDTAPTQLEELLVLVSSIKRVNVAEINSRLADLEVPLSRGRNMAPLESRLDELSSAPPQRANLSNIHAHLNDLSSTPSQRVNLSSIYARLEALEAVQPQRTSIKDLQDRLEKIEAFLGI